MSRPPARHRVRRAALSAMVGLLLVLAAGAAVNSLGATLSVPDWPTSYGRVLPLNFVGNATHEQSHRILVVVAAALLGWLAVAVARHEERRWVRALGFGAAALYFGQTLLGGLVVLWLSPGWLGSLHSVLAQVAFVLVFLVVLATSRRWVESDAGGGPPPAGRLVTVVVHLTFLQIVLGAVSRHPPAGQLVYVAGLLLHFALGLALVGMAVALGVSFRRHGAPAALRSIAKVLGILAVLQLAIAVPLVVVAPEPDGDEHSAPRAFSYLHIAHVLAAALIFGHAAALELGVRREAGVVC